MSTTTTPMPDEHAQRVQRVGRDAPEDGDDEIDAPVGAQVLEHGGEAVAVVRADGGEHVDHVVARVAPGAEHLAGAGDDLDPSAQAHQPRGDRRRRFDRDFERLGVVCARVHVEHDRGARSPPGFVLADHELAGAGRRLPVHAAQVVAQLVVAQGDELVAEVAHHRARRGGLVLGADAAADRDRERRSRARAGARPARLRPRSVHCGARARTGRSPRPPAGRRGTAPGGGSGSGTRRARSPRRRAAAPGSARRGALRRTSRWRRPAGWRGCPGSRRGGRSAPPTRRAVGRDGPGGSPPARAACWNRSQSVTPTTRASAATPSTSISSAPRRKLPTISPRAAPVSDQPRRVSVVLRLVLGPMGGSGVVVTEVGPVTPTSRRGPGPTP